MTHNVVGAVVSAVKELNGFTAVCKLHEVMVILFAAISAALAGRANVKAGCARSAWQHPIVRYGKTVADSARSGKTGAGNDLGTRRDFHAAILDPARDVLNVMAVCSAVAMYAVDEGNATSAGKDSFMVKDTTMDVK